MLKVDSKIFENNNGLMVGVIILNDIDNTNKNLEIKTLLRSAENEIRSKFNSEQLNQCPQILAWREAHKKFGNDSKRYMPSVWAVTKRVVKGGELPIINNLVDLYNYICLKYIIPVGGEDLDKCDGSITLTYANGDENFIEIGGDENNSPEKGEIIYKDNEGVICRKFNWREADRTKITGDTKNAIIVMESLPPMAKNVLENALNEFKDLVKKYCGGDSSSYILEK